jgi:micrococcal nuclease
MADRSARRSQRATPPRPASGPTADDARFVYAAQLVRVVDGDTLDLRIDLGFDVGMEGRFRLFGVNAPERHGATFAAGEAARRLVEGLLAAAGPDRLRVRTYKDRREKYGRYLADVFVGDAQGRWQSVSTCLLQNQLASVYLPDGPAPGTAAGAVVTAPRAATRRRGAPSGPGPARKRPGTVGARQ